MYRGALIRVSAVAELGAAAALMVAPSAAARLVFGHGLDTAESEMVARIAGAALLSIALMCWLSTRRERAAPTIVVAGLSTYNALVVVFLGDAAVVLGMHGLLLWPAILLHIGLLGWCVACLRPEVRPALILAEPAATGRGSSQQRRARIPS